MEKGIERLAKKREKLYERDFIFLRKNYSNNYFDNIIYPIDIFDKNNKFQVIQYNTLQSLELVECHIEIDLLTKIIRHSCESLKTISIISCSFYKFEKLFLSDTIEKEMHLADFLNCINFVSLIRSLQLKNIQSISLKPIPFGNSKTTQSYKNSIDYEAKNQKNFIIQNKDQQVLPISLQYHNNLKTIIILKSLFFLLKSINKMQELASQRIIKEYKRINYQTIFIKIKLRKLEVTPDLRKSIAQKVKCLSNSQYVENEIQIQQFENLNIDQNGNYKIDNLIVNIHKQSQLSLNDKLETQDIEGTQSQCDQMIEDIDKNMHVFTNYTQFSIQTIENYQALIIKDNILSYQDSFEQIRFVISKQKQKIKRLIFISNDSISKKLFSLFIIELHKIPLIEEICFIQTVLDEDAFDTLLNLVHFKKIKYLILYKSYFLLSEISSLLKRNITQFNHSCYALIDLNDLSQEYFLIKQLQNIDMLIAQEQEPNKLSEQELIFLNTLKMKEDKRMIIEFYQKTKLFESNKDISDLFIEKYKNAIYDSVSSNVIDNLNKISKKEDVEALIKQDDINVLNFPLLIIVLSSLANFYDNSAMKKIFLNPISRLKSMKNHLSLFNFFEIKDILKKTSEEDGQEITQKKPFLMNYAMFFDFYKYFSLNKSILNGEIPQQKIKNVHPWILLDPNFKLNNQNVISFSGSKVMCFLNILNEINQSVLQNIKLGIDLSGILTKNVQLEMNQFNRIFPNLVELHLENYTNYLDLNFLNEIFQLSSNLTLLNLVGMNLTNDKLKSVDFFNIPKTLKVLNISENSAIQDLQFLNIIFKKCLFLEALGLRNIDLFYQSKISTIVFSSIPESVQKIDFSFNQIPEQKKISLEFLNQIFRRCPKLTHLFLVSCGITDLSLSQVNFKLLQSSSAIFTKFDIKGNKKMKRLNFFNDLLETCPLITQLQLIDMDLNLMKIKTIDFICCKNLTQINLSKNTMFEHFGFLNDLLYYAPNLTSLILEEVDLTQKKLLNVNVQLLGQQLTEFNISKNKQFDGHYFLNQFFSQTTSIVELNLSEINLNDEKMQILEFEKINSPNLTSITLTKNHIRKNFVRIFQLLKKMNFSLFIHFEYEKIENQMFRSFLQQSNSSFERTLAYQTLINNAQEVEAEEFYENEEKRNQQLNQKQNEKGSQQILQKYKQFNSSIDEVDEEKQNNRISNTQNNFNQFKFSIIKSQEYAKFQRQITRRLEESYIKVGIQYYDIELQQGQGGLWKNIKLSNLKCLSDIDIYSCRKQCLAYLIDLDLTGFSSQNGSFSFLNSILLYATQIQKLNLSNCDLNDSDIFSIQFKSKSLQELNLSQNEQINDFSFINKVLQNCQNLSSLFLQNMDLDDDKLSIIDFKYLRFTKMKLLDFSYNYQIQDFSFLNEMLLHGKYLEQLLFQDIDVVDEQINQILFYQLKYTKLKKFILSQNDQLTNYIFINLIINYSPALDHLIIEDQDIYFDENFYKIKHSKALQTTHVISQPQIIQNQQNNYMAQTQSQSSFGFSKQQLYYTPQKDSQVGFQNHKLSDYFNTSNNQFKNRDSLLMLNNSQNNLVFQEQTNYQQSRQNTPGSMKFLQQQTMQSIPGNSSIKKQIDQTNELEIIDNIQSQNSFIQNQEKDENNYQTFEVQDLEFERCIANMNQDIKSILISGDLNKIRRQSILNERKRSIQEDQFIKKTDRKENNSERKEHNTDNQNEDLQVEQSKESLNTGRISQNLSKSSFSKNIEKQNVQNKEIQLPIQEPEKQNIVDQQKVIEINQEQELQKKEQQQNPLQKSDYRTMPLMITTEKRKTSQKKFVSPQQQNYEKQQRIKNQSQKIKKVSDENNYRSQLKFSDEEKKKKQISTPQSKKGQQSKNTTPQKQVQKNISPKIETQKIQKQKDDEQKTPKQNNKFHNFNESEQNYSIINMNDLQVIAQSEEIQNSEIFGENISQFNKSQFDSKLVQKEFDELDLHQNTINFQQFLRQQTPIPPSNSNLSYINKDELTQHNKPLVSLNIFNATSQNSPEIKNQRVYLKQDRRETEPNILNVSQIIKKPKQRNPKKSYGLNQRVIKTPVSFLNDIFQKSHKLVYQIKKDVENAGKHQIINNKSKNMHFIDFNSEMYNTAISNFSNVHQLSQSQIQNDNQILYNKNQNNNNNSHNNSIVRNKTQSKKEDQRFYEQKQQKNVVEKQPKKLSKAELDFADEFEQMVIENQIWDLNQQIRKYDEEKRQVKHQEFPQHQQYRNQIDYNDRQSYKTNGSSFGQFPLQNNFQLDNYQPINYYNKNNNSNSHQIINFIQPNKKQLNMGKTSQTHHSSNSNSQNNQSKSSSFQQVSNVSQQQDQQQQLQVNYVNQEQNKRFKKDLIVSDTPLQENNPNQLFKGQINQQLQLKVDRTKQLDENILLNEKENSQQLNQNQQNQLSNHQNNNVEKSKFHFQVTKDNNKEENINNDNDITQQKTIKDKFSLQVDNYFQKSKDKQNQKQHITFQEIQSNQVDQNNILNQNNTKIDNQLYDNTIKEEEINNLIPQQDTHLNHSQDIISNIVIVDEQIQDKNLNNEKQINLEQQNINNQNDVQINSNIINDSLNSEQNLFKQQNNIKQTNNFIEDNNSQKQIGNSIIDNEVKDNENNQLVENQNREDSNLIQQNNLNQMLIQQESQKNIQINENSVSLYDVESDQNLSNQSSIMINEQINNKSSLKLKQLNNIDQIIESNLNQSHKILDDQQFQIKNINESNEYGKNNINYQVNLQEQVNFDQNLDTLQQNIKQEQQITEYPNITQNDYTLQNESQILFNKNLNISQIDQDQTNLQLIDNNHNQAIELDELDNEMSASQIQLFQNKLQNTVSQLSQTQQIENQEGQSQLYFNQENDEDSNGDIELIQNQEEQDEEEYIQFIEKQNDLDLGLIKNSQTEKIELINVRGDRINEILLQIIYNADISLKILKLEKMDLREVKQIDPQLSKLDLDELSLKQSILPDMTFINILVLKCNKNISRLNLEDIQIIDMKSSSNLSLEIFEGIKELNLSGRSSSVQSFLNQTFLNLILNKCNSLKKLNLSHFLFDFTNIKVKGFNFLQSLDLSNNRNISVKFINEIINNSNQLIHLNLNGIQLTNETANQLIFDNISIYIKTISLTNNLMNFSELESFQFIKKLLIHTKQSLDFFVIDHQFTQPYHILQRICIQEFSTENNEINQDNSSDLNKDTKQSQIQNYGRAGMSKKIKYRSLIEFIEQNNLNPTQVNEKKKANMEDILIDIIFRDRSSSENIILNDLIMSSLIQNQEFYQQTHRLSSNILIFSPLELKFQMIHFKNKFNLQMLSKFSSYSKFNTYNLIFMGSQQISKDQQSKYISILDNTQEYILSFSSEKNEIFSSFYNINHKQANKQYFELYKSFSLQSYSQLKRVFLPINLTIKLKKQNMTEQQTIKMLNLMPPSQLKLKGQISNQFLKCWYCINYLSPLTIQTQIQTNQKHYYFYNKSLSNQYLDYYYQRQITYKKDENILQTILIFMKEILIKTLYYFFKLFSTHQQPFLFDFTIVQLNQKLEQNNQIEILLFVIYFLYLLLSATIIPLFNIINSNGDKIIKDIDIYPINHAIFIIFQFVLILIDIILLKHLSQYIKTITQRKLSFQKINFVSLNQSIVIKQIYQIIQSQMKAYSFYLNICFITILFISDKINYFMVSALFLVISIILNFTSILHCIIKQKSTHKKYQLSTLQLDRFIVLTQITNLTASYSLIREYSPSNYIEFNNVLIDKAIFLEHLELFFYIIPQTLLQIVFFSYENTYSKSILEASLVFNIINLILNLIQVISYNPTVVSQEMFDELNQKKKNKLLNIYELELLKLQEYKIKKIEHESLKFIRFAQQQKQSKILKLGHNKTIYKSYFESDKTVYNNLIQQMQNNLDITSYFQS